MRVLTTFGLAIALAASAVVARAAESKDLKSGPQVGEEVGAFEVVKAAGNPHDGVKVGEELCYRCKLGSRPVVMVFARTPDEKLAKLIKELDKVVADHSDQKMGAFVNLIGHKEEAAKKAAEKLAEKAGASNIAIVVPKDQPNGPEDYKINPKAEVTVLIYKEGKVAANHALDSLDEKSAKSILTDTSKILN